MGARIMFVSNFSLSTKWRVIINRTPVVSRAQIHTDAATHSSARKQAMMEENETTANVIIFARTQANNNKPILTDEI